MNSPKGVETIFAETLRLSPDQRAARLAQLTEGDADLRRQVESLLASYEAAAFLEQAAAPRLCQMLPITVPLTEKAGDTIGHYKLLQQIGEGGCGVIYMAEQSEPVRRRVALKILKLGMDTKSVIARFEAERQALALMDHPCIAKVFDAGTTETGRPYFVMELVRGMRLTEYCDEKKLAPRERLELFIQVCHAIQHAHQKGIIHRDIKPSNILVTVNDGIAVPKVIDFGIAKATSGQQLTDKTLFTAFEQFIGTPAYMSPEQAVLTSLDIDTRSDIYALGVLLYELLTGKTPFDAKALMAIGLDEMRRTIREQEPQRPSTRLSTLPGQELSTTAQRRGLEPPKLVSELRGDLDWIVMKALEKDRARRYETANGLAMDIQRHLHHEPVVACPPSRLYRLQKTVRRNKLAFTAAGMVVAALVAGLGISTWMFLREREARNRAVAAEEAAKAEKNSAEDVLWFFRDKVLAVGRPEGLGGGLGKDVTLRQAMDAAEPKIAKAFKDRPLVEAAIRKTLGESYTLLGEPGLAVPQLERALALRRQLLGDDNRHTIDTVVLLYQAYRDANKVQQLISLSDETLKLMKAKRGPDDSEALVWMNNLAVAYSAAEKYDQAVPLYEETFKLMKAKLGPAHSETLNTMCNLASECVRAGKLDQGLPLAEEALKLAKAKWGPDRSITIVCMNTLAQAYLEARSLDHSQAGKLDQAISLRKEALKLMQTKRGPDHPDTLVSMNDLAVAYSAAGKSDQAVPFYEETFKLMKAKLGPAHSETLNIMCNLASECVRAGKLDQGLPLAEEALKLMKAKPGPEHRTTLRRMNALGLAYDSAGKSEEAIALHEQTLELRKAALGPEDPDTLTSIHNLALALWGAGQRDRVVSLYEEAFKLKKAKQGPQHESTLITMRLLAMAYRNTGKLDQALPLFEELLELNMAVRGPDHRETDLTTKGLALAYRKAGKLGALEAMWRKQLALPNGGVLAARIELGRLLLEAAKTNAGDSRRSQDLAREGEQLVREFLADVRSRHTNEPLALASRLYDVAEFRYRQGNYTEAAPLYREIIQCRRARLGADHKEVLDPTASLARLLTDWAWAERDSKSEIRNPKSEMAERAREAERLLREVLVARQRDGTNSWRIGDTKSRLGGALVAVAVTDPGLDAAGRDAKLSEAESLLLEGCERLQNTAADPKYRRDALERIARLYEAWNKPDQRSEWAQKLERLAKAQPKSAVSEMQSGDTR